MTDDYDAIVIGIGGVGSAAAYHLAGRGLDVLGLERYGIPHTMGSSHGSTRIHSLTPGRGPDYAPIKRRALDLWRDLEAESGETLYRETGHVRAWPAAGGGHRGGIADAVAALKPADLDYERMDGAAANERFPGYGLPPDHEVIFQPDGGFLDPELTISAHVRRAARRGATIRAHERVVDWRAERDGTRNGDGVRVRTDEGSYRADDLVLAAGSWAASFVDELEGVAVPERRTMAWLQPRDPDAFEPDRFPTFSIDVPEGYYYGTPVHRVPGFKIGNRPRVREVVDPDEMPREATAAEEEVLRNAAERHFPRGAGPTTRLSACLITMTPGEQFVVDRHPDHPNVTFTGGFSGSGFHVSAAVGELLADLTTGDEPALDPTTFALAGPDGA